MRQVISTAITALIVAALTAVSIGAMAQSEPAPAAEREITPAGLNADKVDGRHAVKYTNKKNRRRGKLVATNAVGELPSNIVRPFWGYVKNKPGILADDQITWDEVVGRPGTPTIKLAVFNQGWSFPAGTGFRTIDVPCPAGSTVTGGGYRDVNGYNSNYLVSSYPLNASTWRVQFQDNDTGSETGDAYAICLSAENVTLAGRLTPAAKNASGNDR